MPFSGMPLSFTLASSNTTLLAAHTMQTEFVFVMGDHSPDSIYLSSRPTLLEVTEQ
jgi:hypothetical protein